MAEIEVTRRGAAEVVAEHPVFRLKWGAVFAGLVVALALQVVLTLLGTAIGLSAVGPGTSARGIGIGAGIWMIVTALIAVWEWLRFAPPHALSAFLGAVALFLMSFIGIAISLWPMIVPYRYTLWQAASSPSTQAFLLVGTLFLLPIILMYTGWSYWVFRGKIKAGTGYH